MFSDFIHACEEFSFKMWKMFFQSKLKTTKSTHSKKKKKKEPAIICVSDKD